VTPLPGPLGGKELVAWRIDQQVHAATWDSGEGAFQVGGRWNSPGVRAVYCSVDPATAIIEVAVHKGFAVLDTVPHMLTRFEIKNPSDVHVVEPEAVANSNWLVPGTPSAGQQAFGDGLLATHKFILIPSTVSKHSWNLVFVAARASDAYHKVQRERLAIDTRLNPPAKR
jgi:RES domain-containing protein